MRFKWFFEALKFPLVSFFKLLKMVHSRKGRSSSGRQDARETFCIYYKAQFPFMKEDEFNRMLNTMDEPLPVTFRINQSKSSCPTKVEQSFFEHVNNINERLRQLNQPELVPMPISWCESGVFQISLSRKELRHLQEYDALKNFFVNQMYLGNLTRQELVSMIPPILLNVQPNDKVLDMCAAPGSKTSQILENFATSPGSGFVIANDRSIHRCYTLWHQLKRFNCSKVAVVNHDAAMLPNWRYKSKECLKEKEYCNLMFDKILCDVPCSGDGTSRKNNIFLHWKPNIAYNLHSIQLKIAMRAVELLNNDGGTMVYSTCSLNPVENEAVIARLLNMFPEQLSIEEIDSGVLNGLKWAPGLTKWVLMDTKDRKSIYSCHDEISCNVDKNRCITLSQLFPPENVDELHLDRCIRIFPHIQNTGGFFVCVLRKLRRTRPDRVRELELIRTQERQEKMQLECPYVFIKNNEQLYRKIKLSLEKLIPEKIAFPYNLLSSRDNGSDTRKNIYFIHESLHPLLQLNIADRLKLVGAGIRFMTLCNFGCESENLYRLSGEAIEIALEFVDTQKCLVDVPSAETFIALIKEPLVTIGTADKDTQCLTERLRSFDSGDTVIFKYNQHNFIKPHYVIGKIGRKRKDDNNSSNISVRTFISHSYRWSILSIMIDDPIQVEFIMKNLKLIENAYTNQ
ncbi:hypothetical protein ACOME3_000047 [Neoechinorhynchus agilis]